MATADNETLIVGSFAPDSFVSGRPDKIVATITGGYLFPFKFKSGKHMLFAHLEFEPDPDSGQDPFYQNYQAGFLSSAVPGTDPTTPAGGDFEFYKALGNGTASIPEGEEDDYRGTYLLRTPSGGMAQKTDFKQFIDSLATCGFQGWGPSIECMFGLKVYLHLADQVNAGDRKPNDDGTPKKNYQVLIVGDILEDPTKGKTNGKAGAAKGATSNTAAKKSSTSTPAADETGEDKFRTRVESLVSAELATTSPQATQMVFKKVLAKLTDANEKRDGLALLKNSEWLNAIERPWTVDGSNLEKVG